MLRPGYGSIILLRIFPKYLILKWFFEISKTTWQIKYLALNSFSIARLNTQMNHIVRPHMATRSLINISRGTQNTDSATARPKAKPLQQLAQDIQEWINNSHFFFFLIFFLFASNSGPTRDAKYAPKTIPDALLLVSLPPTPLCQWTPITADLKISLSFTLKLCLTASESLPSANDRDWLSCSE